MMLVLAFFWLMLMGFALYLRRAIVSLNTDMSAILAGQSELRARCAGIEAAQAELRDHCAAIEAKQAHLWTFATTEEADHEGD